MCPRTSKATERPSDRVTFSSFKLHFSFYCFLRFIVCLSVSLVHRAFRLVCLLAFLPFYFLVFSSLYLTSKQAILNVNCDSAHDTSFASLSFIRALALVCTFCFIFAFRLQFAVSFVVTFVHLEQECHRYSSCHRIFLVYFSSLASAAHDQSACSVCIWNNIDDNSRSSGLCFSKTTNAKKKKTELSRW